MKDTYMNIRNLFIISLLLLTRQSFASENKPSSENQSTSSETEAATNGNDIADKILTSVKALEKNQERLIKHLGVDQAEALENEIRKAKEKKQASKIRDENPQQHRVPSEPTFISRLWNKCSDILGKGANVIAGQAQERPGTSLALVGATLGSAALYSYHTSPSIQKIVRKKIEVAKEKADEHYYDFFDEYLLPLICEWKDMEDEHFTAKDALYVGAGLSALYGASKINEAYGISTSAQEKFFQYAPIVKGHAETLKLRSLNILGKLKVLLNNQYQNNTTAAHYVAGSLATIAGSYLVYKLIRSGNQSYTRLLEDFWDSMSDEQQEKIKTDFMELMIDSRSNPISLQTLEFVEMLSEEQLVLLNKIIEQYTKEAAFARS